ncbi:putative ubiquitin-like-specific protease 2B [Senna tora]|uniref:Putative ubiquitin-like-specific protease 2B n=1 Tax=Senna tora TaxID=362788 RepID=A0A834TWS1_9FABA|nr:putative ubiquitin-like-specific protease 2B [Senna tora]
MNKSPRRDLQVSDLKEDEENVDIVPAKQPPEFRNPSLDDQSVLKYEFLGYVSQVEQVSKKDAFIIPCVDVDIDAIGGNFNLEKGVSDPPLGTLEEKNSELEAVQQSNSVCLENDPGSKLDIHRYNGSIEIDTKDNSDGVHVQELSEMEMAPSGSPSRIEFVDATSEADERVNESTPSSSASDIAENVSLNGPGWNHCIGYSDMEDMNTEVVLYPDYVIYQDNYYIGSKLTFSHCCIKINGSIECINQGAINLEWAADDLIDIKCQLFQSNGKILVKLHVISSNEGHSKNFNSSSGTGDLKIAFVDSNWSLRHQQITSLNVKYSDIWNIVLDTDMEGNENILLGSRCYFPNFDEPFDEVIYPKGDPDAVSLTKRDVDLLQPDTFINDTVIDFYINLHWSLIVICHPGDVVSFNGDELDKPLKVPCILHMDSIKGSHSGLKNLVQSYLWEEWKERQKGTHEDLSSRFLNMRFLPLALPQQENSFDCGLFLLHYLELFLAEAPANFNPFKLTKFSHFLNVDWFPPAEAYLKRTLIQRLIFELLENRPGEFSSAYTDRHYSENDNRNGVEFLGRRCSPEINGESTTSHDSQGIEITLLSASSSLDPHSLNNSGLVLRELFEPGAGAGELLGQCQSFDHRPSDYRLSGSLFPIEEETETSEHFMYLTTEAKFQQDIPQTCEFSYTSRGCGADTCHRPEISPLAEDDKAESSLDTSCASDDSDDIGIIENCPTVNEAESSEEAKQHGKNCLSMENLEFSAEIAGSAACNLPLSRDSDTVCNSSKSGLVNSCCVETATTPLHEASDAVEDKVSFDDVQTVNLVVTDLCDEQAAKRRRVLPMDCESNTVGTLTQESHP